MRLQPVAKRIPVHPIPRKPIRNSVTLNDIEATGFSQVHLRLSSNTRSAFAGNWIIIRRLFSGLFEFQVYTLVSLFWVKIVRISVRFAMREEIADILWSQQRLAHQESCTSCFAYNRLIKLIVTVGGLEAQSITPVTRLKRMKNLEEFGRIWKNLEEATNFGVQRVRSIKLRLEFRA